MPLLLCCFFIGFFTGLRSLTPVAVTAWCVYSGALKPGHPFSWLGSLPSVAIFTLLALGELVADKLPRTPNRTAPVGFIARILMGALTGATLAASASGSAAIGALLGVAGAVTGTFAGFKARTGIVRGLAVPDIAVALLEDLIAIGGSFLVASHL
jgi:uncharacterized membrane protein